MSQWKAKSSVKLYNLFDLTIIFDIPSSLHQIKYQICWLYFLSTYLTHCFLFTPSFPQPATIISCLDHEDIPQTGGFTFTYSFFHIAARLIFSKYACGAMSLSFPIFTVLSPYFCKNFQKLVIFRTNTKLSRMAYKALFAVAPDYLPRSCHTVLPLTTDYSKHIASFSLSLIFSSPPTSVLLHVLFLHLRTLFSPPLGLVNSFSAF